MDSQTAQKTVWILISYLLYKPADLDLCCLFIVIKDVSRVHRTRVRKHRLPYKRVGL